MKRLALLLGSLLVVSAAASAKEVVPAPVVVEEAPVQIVEKEVIVYRDKEEGFRPNGYVDLQYRYYGQTEGQDSVWNKNNNYSRIQLQGQINMTEKQSLEYRVRAYNSLDEHSDSVVTPVGYKGGDTETRLRYFYDHGLVGDSKVDLTSRVHYNNTDGDQELEYQARFDFAEYLFNNDFIQTTSFILAPKYGYGWGDGNGADYDNRIGADFYSTYTLPWGFSAEFNLYATQHFYGEDQAFDGGRKLEDKNFTLDMEAYIYNTTNLYTNGNYSVDFGFEGGYDAYNWSQEKQFGSTERDNANYSLYALPYIQLNYQATEFVTVYAAVGAEYRDWTVSNQNSASHWRWQPTAWAGFKTTF